jgi:hypothetical protein
MTSLTFKAAALATSPSRDPDSSRSIKDTTRQAIERSFQVASSPVASSEWESEIGRGEFVGDVVWSLANILWRIYAEVGYLQPRSRTNVSGRRIADNAA